MLNNVLEISKRVAKGGRVPIKIALLKIHEDENETNKNGLHWNETYVTNAMESAVSMPICAEFISEDKDVPLGHGLTGTVVDENGISEPVFENSETVGVIESVSIETIKDGEEDIKVLCGNGVLYNQRYPNFVKWIRTNYANDNKIDTSIEIVGLSENNNRIVYADPNPTEEFRTPKDFLFSGTAILSLSPADDNAIVLEVAQKKDKEEDNKMEFDMNEVKKVIADTINELNSKEAQFEIKMAELNSQLEAKDTVIAEKDTELCAKEETIVELNATVEQVKQALKDLEDERAGYWEEREALLKQLGELKAKERLGELNSAIECFTEVEKKYAESEINSFNEAPEKGDIDAIVSKIYSGIGQASKKASEEAKIAEQNSKNDPTVEDIFSEVCSVKTTEEEIDDNIF